MFFLLHGYRVVAADRRGHGRSAQVADGHDMDHYADDLAAVIEHLDLHDAIHVGHSTGGGEVARYIARHGESRVAKAVLISSVPPLMVQTEANPGGLPKSVFDGFQDQVATNRSGFYRDLAAGPFYGFNRPGVEAVGGHHRELVAAGHDRRRQGALRRHRRVLADRLHRGPEEDHGPGPGHARRRRPDRPLRRLRAAVGQAGQNGTLKTYHGLPARHAHHPGGDDQRRPARLAPVLTPRTKARLAGRRSGAGRTGSDMAAIGGLVRASRPDQSSWAIAGLVRWDTDWVLGCRCGHVGLLGRTGAPCQDCSWWVSPARPPNPACASQRTGLSTCLARWG